jgi:DNA-binding NarL/FixJ family response regulator
MRLLLVDDQVDLRHSLRRICEARGFEVVGEGSDGVEGVRLASELRPDCIVMDMRMPNMDGLEATRLIKQASPEIVVVVLSAYDDASLRKEAIDAGAAEWFLKGEPARKLCDRLSELFGPNDELTHVSVADGS